MSFPQSGIPSSVHLIRRAILAAVLLVVSAGWAAVAAQEVPLVHSDKPLQPPRTVHFEELWRLGGENDDIMFGLMVAALEDDQGRVYLMDQQLCQVTMVSPEGEVLGTLFAQGEGPGEVRSPNGMAFLPDGTLALAEQFPGKLVRVNLDGTPADNLTIGRGREGGFTMLTGVTTRGNVIVAGTLFQAPIENGQSRTSYLSRLDEGGQEICRYVEHETKLDFQKAHFIEREMTAPFFLASGIGPDGKVYALKERNAYLIDVYDPKGGLIRTISRQFEPKKRTKREKDRWNALFEVQARQLDFPITWEVEQYERAVTRMHVDDQGRLWVQHARSDEEQPEGIFLTYDLFDPEGCWLQEVRFACDANPAYDGLIFLGGDRLLLVKGLILAELTATGSQGAVFDEEEEGGDRMEVIYVRMTD